MSLEVKNSLKLSLLHRTDPGVNELRDRINYQLSQAGSSAAVTDVQLDYDTKLTGRGLNTSIDYKVILTLDLTNHVLRESSVLETLV